MPLLPYYEENTRIYSHISRYGKYVYLDQDFSKIFSIYLIRLFNNEEPGNLVRAYNKP